MRQAGQEMECLPFLPPLATSRPTVLGLGRIVCKKESRKCDVHAFSLPSSKQTRPFLSHISRIFSLWPFLGQASCARVWHWDRLGGGGERGSGTSWFPSLHSTPILQPTLQPNFISIDQPVPEISPKAAVVIINCSTG